MRLTKFAKHFKNPNKFAPKFRKFGFFAKTSLFFGSAFILSDWIRNPFVEYSKFNNRFKNDEESKKIFFEHSAVPFLGAIIGINVFVHCFWQFSKIYKPLEKIMVKHFTLQSHVFARNPHTLITHMFSHHSVLHLLVNIVCLTSFSNVLLPAIGVSDFAKIYFGSGLFGAFLFLLEKYFSATKPLGAVGLSGAALGIFAATTLLYPFNSANVIFLPSVDFEMQHLLVGVIMFDLMGLLLRWKLFSHSGHLGGLLFGLLGFHVLSRSKGTTNEGISVFDPYIYKGPLKKYRPIGNGYIFDEKSYMKIRCQPMNRNNFQTERALGPSVVSQ